MTLNRIRPFIFTAISISNVSSISVCVSAGLASIGFTIPLFSTQIATILTELSRTYGRPHARSTKNSKFAVNIAVENEMVKTEMRMNKSRTALCAINSFPDIEISVFINHQKNIHLNWKPLEQTQFLKHELQTKHRNVNDFLFMIHISGSCLFQFTFIRWPPKHANLFEKANETKSKKVYWF